VAAILVQLELLLWIQDLIVAFHCLRKEVTSGTSN
jgi:hypothetical protein